jgi:TRAP-type C4-dicarboxylate transport system substrate-binding protein
MKRFVLLVPLLLAACSEPLPQGVTELVYATPYAASHPFSLADQAWMAFVEERSGGTLQIRPSWSGALLSSEHSMLELRHGVADIGLITPIYVKGGTHLIRIQSGFYSGTTTMEQQLALYRCLEAGNAQFATELEGLKILAVQGGGLPGIVTTQKPIHSLADLQGMRIRAPTELLGVLRELGADPVNMPMGEVYSALAKGVLDGVVAPTDTFRSLHFAEVADHFVTMHIPRGAYPARAMAMERWNTLSAEHQQVLDEGVAIWEAALERENEKALGDGLELAQQDGVNFTTLPPEEQQRFDALYLTLAERNAQSLARYGIDGTAVFALSRQSIGADGGVTCPGVQR